MKKILFLLISVFAFARVNPFIPVITNENNHTLKKSTFQSKKLSLPSDARVLKSIIIKYQALNGSIKTITYPINKYIDWHDPLYVSTQIKKFNPIELKVGFLTFYIQQHKTLIQTNNKIIRHFMLVRPFRYVIDFRANKNFLTFSKTSNSFIKKIVLGNHRGFYRVVLYLDGTYKVHITKTAEGYLVVFK
jgi:hypothetical protein